MKIEVGIEPDAIERLTKATADQAVEELIWNAIDAEAHRIDVEFTRNPATGIERILVADDGHGISHEQAQGVFGSIGGSPKRLRRTSPNLERPYHGREGRGRYKAFALGKAVVWQSKALDGGKLLSFNISLDSSQMKTAVIQTPEQCDGRTGCNVLISSLHDTVSSLDNQTKLDSLASRLAPYLIANPSIRVSIDGETLDPHQAVLRDKKIEFTRDRDGETDSFVLNVLEWKRTRKPSMFWCTSQGIAVDEIRLSVHSGRRPFSAYVVSDRIQELHEADSLAMDDLSQEVREIKSVVKERLTTYFRQREAEEASLLVKRIQAEGIYPYKQQASSEIEKAERQVFDICTATVHEYMPKFEKVDKQAREFTYRLLKEALEQGPTNLKTILDEVLRLTDEERASFTSLLEKTTLGAIIQSAKLVSDRLALINGLEQIVHEDPVRKHLKERKQLHRILVDELWIFGDEYTLGSDDVSLKKVLVNHLDVLGLPPLDAGADRTGLADIPDLLLWRQFLRGQNDCYEHLVIELKRPKVNISLEEIAQVKKYATKVLGNRHFDKAKTRWKFVALSDGIAADAKEDVDPVDREPGHVHRGKHHDIWVLTWSQIIQRAKVRLNWIRDRLELQVASDEEGMAYLRSKYDDKLPLVAKAGGARTASTSRDREIDETDAA